MYSNDKARSLSVSSRTRFKLGRYKSLMILIALLSGWITIHITRAVIDFHNNKALKTQERTRINEKSAMEFRVHQEELAMDYQYGNMVQRDIETDVPDVDASDQKSTSRQPEVTVVTGKSIKNDIAVGDEEEASMRRMNIDELELDSQTSKMEKLKANGMENRSKNNNNKTISDRASNDTVTRVIETVSEMPVKVLDELVEYRDEVSQTENVSQDAKDEEGDKDYEEDAQ